jgi:IS4 transposase
MDRAYVDYAGLDLIQKAGAFFVTRAKSNMDFTRHSSRPKDVAAGVCSDQVGKLGGVQARKDFPWPLRRVRFHDRDTGKYLTFLTNNLELPAVTIAGLYKARWQVELFFRWIKSHLKIKHFYGTSPNAVKTQIWTAMATYAMIAILHKQLKAPGTLFRTTQLLSVHPFDKTPLPELLTETSPQSHLDSEFQPLLFNDL